MNFPRMKCTALAACLLTFALEGFSGVEKVNGATIESDAAQIEAEFAALADGHGQEERALAGLMVAVMDNGRVVYEGAFGQAFIDPEVKNSRPLSTRSLVRVASISKTLSAIVVMQLVDEGLLDLDRDVSGYLGWPLKNPHYPERAITLRQLLSHTSSIRDAGESYIIRYPRNLREAFEPEAPEYADRFQRNGNGDRGPGVFYEYSNLNFGVIGTILERVTGTRFDVLMQQRFYHPLGIRGGFNVAAFSDDEKRRLATLYRKRGPDGRWNPEGPWVPQVDDLSSGIPTALPDDAFYTPGTNGAQFSPQGGARLSLRGLQMLALLLMGDGQAGNIRLLSPDRMAELRRPVWRYDPAMPNTARYTGRLNERSAGLRIVSGKTPGDRLFADDDGRWIGHFGEAYGLLAGVWVQPETGRGAIYAITGTAFDPHANADDSTSLTPIEKAVLERLGSLFTR